MVMNLLKSNIFFEIYICQDRLTFENVKHYKRLFYLQYIEPFNYEI